MSFKSVLVTGAAGFIGSHLTERCLSLGWRVTAVDAFIDNYSATLKRRNIGAFLNHAACNFIRADLLTLDLVSLLEDVTVVFHLAAQPGVRPSWDHFANYVPSNIVATHRLLDAARHADIERFVLASSSSVYGNAPALPTKEDERLQPLSPYGVTKVASEQLATAYWDSFGVPSVILRYFTVYGPRQRPDMAFHRLIASAVLGTTFEVLGDGNQTRDFTFVTDVVSATIGAAQSGRPGSIYNIAGGSRHSMNSVIAELSDVTDVEIRCRYAGRQRGDARDTAADISRAQVDLGFEPSVELRAGLEGQLAWQREMLASACSSS